MVNYKEKIDSNPGIMLGKPKIKGTRITIELILRKISDGYSFEEILEMYPNLIKGDILAAIGYAAAILESEEVIRAA